MKCKPILILTFAFALLFTVENIRQVAEAEKAVELAFEAELGKIEAPIEADKDKKASNSQYASPPPGAGNFVGSIEYRILIPKQTKYYIWGRVIAPHGGNDSYFVTWDGEDRGENDGVNVWDTVQTVTWQWDMVMGRGHSDPKAFELTRGEHTLRMWGREAGTKLDCLFISDNQKAVPRQPTQKEIANQKPDSVIGGLAVDPIGKLAATWGEIKLKGINRQPN